jgi:hypothetical protein
VISIRTGFWTTSAWPRWRCSVGAVRRSELGACEEAIRLIHKDGGSRTEELLKFTSVLALITLDGSTIEKIVEEAGMTAESIAEVYRNTVWGRVLQDVGREEGREEGLEVGREEMLADLLEDRFGPDPSIRGIAHRLAVWPRGAVHAANTATRLSDLAEADPPS